MPSPFPGMDPYLEHPARWPGVHIGLISALRVLLNTLLPERYVANAGERLYVVQPERNIYPDAFIVDRGPAAPTESRGATATISPAADPSWKITAEPREVREPFIEILLARAPEQVVTVIEVLSPANKMPGHSGRGQYEQKQRELLESRVSLLEIDLLRRGAHTVAAPRAELLRKGSWDYLVSLHRGDRRWEYDVWPVQLRERLPRIRVPLTEGESDVALDLQAVFDRFYDENAYARLIDYQPDPKPPLNPDDASWADALLKERGLRE